MKGSFKTALIAAVVSAFVAAGAAVATTQTFVLGTTDRVNAATKVTNLQANGTTVNPVDAPLMTLENKSTSANSTPLSLVAASGHSPLKVNTQTKVTNLNADQLDGKDSSALVQGKGKTYNLAVAITRLSNTDNVYSPSPPVVPGFVNVLFACPPTASSGGVVGFANLAGSSENLFLRNDLHTDAGYFAIPPSIGSLGFGTDGSGDLTTATLNGLPGGVQTTSWIQVASKVNPTTCYFQVQALTTSS
jgi:hypothetical protein